MAFVMKGFIEFYRIVNGKGTNGESFDWKYKDEKPYLTNNSWDVFDIEDFELKIDEYEKSKTLLKEAEKQFKILNENYEYKDFDIYNQLSSLKPYKKEK